MEGRAGEVQTGAFLVALRAKGETVSELIGLARTMRTPRHPRRDRAHRSRRHGRDRRRALDLQRLDHGGADRCRRGLRGRQARQPLEHVAIGLGRHARGARGRDHVDAGAGRRGDPKDRLRLHVRARPPRGDEARDPGPAASSPSGRSSTSSARSRIRRERPGSCSASPTAATRRRSPRPSPGSTASTRSWSPPTTASTRSRSPDRPGSSRSGTGARANGSPTRPSSGSPRPPLETIAGGEPEENAATARAVLAGEHSPAADIAVLNAGAAIYVGGARRRPRRRRRRRTRGDRLRRRCHGPPRARRDARRRSGWLTADRRRSGSVASRPDEQIGSARRRGRDGVAQTERGKTRRPAPFPACRTQRASPVQGSPGPARPLGDRRVQARFPVGRPDQPRRRRRGGRRRLRARRRGGDIGPDRRDALPRIARRPRGGSGRDGAADPPQGLHRRPLPALGSVASPAPTRSS